MSSSPPISTPQVTPLPAPKSKIWLWILGGVLLLGTGIVMGVFLGKQLYPQPTLAPSPSPLSQPTQTHDPTANWKTYIYQDLVFRYPVDWVLDTEKMAIRPPYLKNGEEYPAITFYTIDNPDNLSVKEYDDKAGNAMMRPGLYSSSIGAREVTAEAKILNGINGYYLKGQNCEPLGCDRFSFVSNKKIYVITNIFDHQDISSQNSEKESLRKVFDQILSTFKFLKDPNQVENIKTVKSLFEGRYIALGLDPSKVKINDVVLLGKYTDKYVVSYTPNIDYIGSGQYTLVGKYNGKWIMPESGDAIYCDWVKNSGADEATIAFMGPICK